MVGSRRRVGTRAAGTVEHSRLRRLEVRARRGLRRPERRLTGIQRRAREELLRRLGSGELRTVPSVCLCGGDEDLHLMEADRYGLPSPSVICLRCGIVRTSPHLDAGSLATFYRELYRPLYTGSAVPPDAFWFRQVKVGEAIAEFLERNGAPRFERVADVGCGAGGMLVAFHLRGAEVHGCDLGGEYLTAGRRRGLDLREGGTEVLRPVGPFDLVILSHVLEHVVDPISFLRDEVGPLLRPDGWVYVELPGLLAIRDSYGDPLQYFQNAHLWNFTATTLDRTLGLAGFTRIAGDETIRAAYGLADMGARSGAEPPLGQASRVLDALAMAEEEHGRLRRRVPRAGRRWARRGLDRFDERSRWRSAGRAVRRWSGR